MENWKIISLPIHTSQDNTQLHEQSCKPYIGDYWRKRVSWFPRTSLDLSWQSICRDSSNCCFMRYIVSHSIIVLRDYRDISSMVVRKSHRGFPVVVGLYRSLYTSVQSRRGQPNICVTPSLTNWSLKLDAVGKRRDRIGVWHSDIYTTPLSNVRRLLTFEDILHMNNCEFDRFIFFHCWIGSLIRCLSCELWSIEDGFRSIECQHIWYKYQPNHQFLRRARYSTPLGFKTISRK